MIPHPAKQISLDSPFYLTSITSLCLFQELLEFHARSADFAQLNCRILGTQHSNNCCLFIISSYQLSGFEGCSMESIYSHLNWCNTPRYLGTHLVAFFTIINNRLISLVRPLHGLAKHIFLQLYVFLILYLMN